MKKQSLTAILRALRHRNFRLFFYGQSISLIGTWMQAVATGWLVYRMSGSSFMLGLVAFAGQIPAFFLSPVTGVLGDRYNRHHIILITQILAMIQAAVLAFLTLMGIVRIWQIFILSFFLGLLNAFEMPARQAFVVELIDDKNDLSNAIALSSAMFNASRLIGPSLAGILVALAGEGLCFGINALSYTSSMASLLLMKLKPYQSTGTDKMKLFPGLKEGLRYTLYFTPIRDLLITVAFMSFIAMSFPVLMPVFAKTILHGDSHTYGFLVASSGAGALAGTVFLAMRSSVLGLGRVIRTSLAVFGTALFAFSLSTSLFASIVSIVIVGSSMISVVTSCNTLVQTIVDEDKRGRVMSFYVMAFMGSAPLGSLVFGSVSHAIGAPAAVAIAGFLSILGTILFSMRLKNLREKIRPIYQELGIIPEVATAIQTTDELRKPPEYSGS